MAFQPTLPNTECLLVCKVLCKHYGKMVYGPIEQKAARPHSYFIWQISVVTSAGSCICYGSQPPIRTTDWSGKQAVDRCRYPEPHKLTEQTWRDTPIVLIRLLETISVRTSIAASNSKNSPPLCVKVTNHTAPSRRGDCPAAPPNPPKPKPKTQRFCSYNIKRFTWFTLQAKSATEMGG